MLVVPIKVAFCRVMRMTDAGQSPSKRLVLPRCPSCGTETSLHAQVCPSCGSSMKVKTAPPDITNVWDEGSWQGSSSGYGVRKPAPQVRRHRFRLRRQLIVTILITVIAFSAGLALGPYVTTYRSTQSQEPVTVTQPLTVTITSVSTSSVTSTASQVGPTAAL